LCGTRQGIFVRVTEPWRNFLNVSKALRVPDTSDKHVDLYKYMKRHGKASNAELTEVLHYNYSSQTSKFLREAEYVKRIGSGISSRWFLVDRKK
jgi:ATP-dependent DNA helicase RecG